MLGILEAAGFQLSPSALEWMYHVSSFSILGALIYIALSLSIRRSWYVLAVLALGAGITLGALDELHQMFVRERSAQLADVGRDAIGVVAGILIASLSAMVLRPTKRPGQRQERSRTHATTTRIQD